MRICKLFLTILVIVLLGWIPFSSVRAVPPLPSTFWGIVTINGENVPAGIEVSAWINGIQYANTETIIHDGQSKYIIDVPGDNPSTPGVIEGGEPGDVITFKVGNLVAPETATWQSGNYNQHDLTLMGEVQEKYQIFLPMVLK